MRKVRGAQGAVRKVLCEGVDGLGCVVGGARDGPSKLCKACSSTVPCEGLVFLPTPCEGPVGGNGCYSRSLRSGHSLLCLKCMKKKPCEGEGGLGCTYKAWHGPKKKLCYQCEVKRKHALAPSRPPAAISKRKVHACKHCGGPKKGHMCPVTGTCSRTRYH